MHIIDTNPLMQRKKFKCNVLVLYHAAIVEWLKRSLHCLNLHGQLFYSYTWCHAADAGKMRQGVSMPRICHKSEYH